MWQSFFLYVLLVLTAAGLAAPRRPLVRLPRGAARTGDYMIVADKSLSSEDFRLLLARVSRLSNGATVRSYVENVGKVITASLSPYALEMVSGGCFFARFSLCKLVMITTADASTCVCIQLSQFSNLPASTIKN